MTKLQTIAESFQEFQRIVLPKNVGSIQLQETRRAFYAGIAYLMGEMGKMDDSVSEDEGAAYLGAVNAELLAFSAAIANGKA